MKKFILSLIFASVSLALFAQNTISSGITTIKKTVTVEADPIRSTGPVLSFGLGLGPAVFPSVANSETYKAIGPRIGLGYQVTPKFYFGAASGTTGTTHYSGFSVPIVAEARFYSSEKARSSLFLNLEAGYNPIGPDEVTKAERGGMYMIDKGPVVGLGFGLSTSMFSALMNIEYNNCYSTFTATKEDMIYVGFFVYYHFLCGRKY